MILELNDIEDGKIILTGNNITVTIKEHDKYKLFFVTARYDGRTLTSYCTEYKLTDNGYIKSDKLPRRDDEYSTIRKQQQYLLDKNDDPPPPPKPSYNSSTTIIISDRPLTSPFFFRKKKSKPELGKPGHTN